MIRETTTIITGEEVRKALAKGSEEMAKAVSTTFGPYGRNVAMTKIYNLPHVTKDGATVARDINFKDPSENVAAQIIKQAAERTAQVAGDGTTSTTILANSIIQKAFNNIGLQNTQPTLIKRTLKEMESLALKALDGISNPVTPDDILHIALVACNGDSEIAELITNAFNTIGEHGVITVTDSKNYSTFVDSTEGIKLDRSHIAPGLSKGLSSVKHEGCRIAVTNLQLKTQEDAIAILNLQAQINEPILLICDDLLDKALEIISYNKIERGVPIEVIRAPYIAEARKDACRDLAIVTGAKLLDHATGWTMTSIKEEQLGSCDNLEITLKETNIIGRKGDPALIAERVKYYEDKIASDHEGLADNYKKRLGFFSAGAAVVYVGGANEVEVKEKKDRLDDTIRAVRSALAEGFVAGGATSYSILGRAIMDVEPTNLLANALLELEEVLVKKSDSSIKDHRESVEANHILDPTLVIKSTIQNAIGAAIMIFTTDCIVIKDEE